MPFPDLLLDLSPGLLDLILAKLNYHDFVHLRKTHRAFSRLRAPKFIRDHFHEIQDLDKGFVLVRVTAHDIAKKTYLGKYARLQVCHGCFRTFPPQAGVPASPS